MEAMLTDPANNRRKGKPAVKKEIPGLDTMFLGLAQKNEHNLSRLFDAFHPSFVAVAAFIDPLVDSTDPVALFF